MGPSAGHCPESWLEMRLGDSKTYPHWGLRSCAASTISSTSLLISLLLAPEPSNLAGKDKCKPCVPTPMDLITRQQFPGAETISGFGRRSGGWYVGCGGGFIPEMFLTEALLTCLLWAPAAADRGGSMANCIYFPSYEV